MAYPYYGGYQPGYQNPYYPQTTVPMPDQLSQLRQNQPSIQAQPQVQPMQNSGSPIWVQGEAGARGYLVAAGNTVLLMDSESPVFYLKSVDANNIPQPLRVFDYTERNMAPRPHQMTQEVSQPVAEYATREELRALEERVESLTSAAKDPTKGRKTTKEETDNG